MEGRGRLAQPAKRSGAPRAAGKARAAPARREPGEPPWWRQAAVSAFVKVDRTLLRWAHALTAIKPRYAGVAATTLIIVGSLGYGISRGEHLPAVLQAAADVRDATGNALGFRIASVAVDGRRHMTEQEVLAAGGITERSSLLFLDVDAVRRKLEAVPWITQATVRKLYPGRLEISIIERDAFALWQREGKLFIIAEDGTVLGPYEAGRTPPLPLVVGPGAAPRARDFLALLDRFPELREQLRAAVLVAERRWNLKLKSGLDVRLPETGIEAAFDKLLALDRSKKILTRDLTAIDLRLPDRVTIRLSDEAAQAREQAIKEKEKKKRKGGAA